MAEEQIVTRIVATSDFSNLIADLGKVSSALTNLQTKLNATNKNLAAQVAVMNRSFADTLRSTGQFSTHFVNLTSDVDKFGSQLDKGQIKLRQFFQVYQGHLKTNGGLIRQLAQQQVQLQNAILQPLGKNAEGLMQYNVHIPTGLDKVKSKTALARQELQIMNRVIQEGANSLINWGKNTQWAGRQLTVGLTVPLAAFGAASAKAFREADQELTRLTKVYGGLAATSASDLGKIRKEVTQTASELSKAYGSSFKETIALGADIAATGKQGNELLGSIKETTRLAVLGEVDRQDAMKATLAIQSAFKQNTEELADSINFLNAVENQTSTTLNDLVEAIPKAGPIIKGLGGSIEDLALYLTAMREGGINASEGANALKSGLASLINPTKVAKEMFAGFGISLTDIVQKNAGNTTETLLALQSALDNLNPLQKQQALEQLFGKFQFARMNALFENLGRQGSQTLQVMDLMKASSQDLANIAGRELSMVTESASGKYRRALEGLKADLAGVGEQFLTINTHLINLVDGILKFVNKLPGPIKTILTFFAGLTAVAGPLIMLTGVLANFFGYVIKGASHFRSLFKGGEGWKLLTPEILAANKAGSIAEQTFYNDAKAADILNQAISRLSASYTRLAADAANAIIQTNPGISTMAGTPIMLNRDPRIANPAHPLIGLPDTRSAAHARPRGLMTKSERDLQTIHSVTPLPLDVNKAVGKNPQIFTYQNMPNVPGLTTRGGVSTGIVAGEAAKWHTLMATLSMQTKQEVAMLNKEINRTGLVSQEFLTSYSQILPQMTKVIDTAVMESELIVKQTMAGKMRVDQAQAAIIKINAQLEQAMAQTTATMAQQMGRTANLTSVPLLNQPVVDLTGKSNMKELFRPDRPAKKMLDAIARATGVKTWGGGYSIETTMPKKYATGGTVVPGPRSDTTDTQFGNLIEGDFVLNRKASDALMGYNKGGRVVPAMLTPGELVVHNPTKEEIGILEAYNNKFAMGGQVKNNRYAYGAPAISKNDVGLDRVDMLYNYIDNLTNENYASERRANTILNDSIALTKLGMPIDKAIQTSTKIFDTAMKYADGDPSKYQEYRDLYLQKNPKLQSSRGRQNAASPEIRQAVADRMKSLGFKDKLYPHANRAHIARVGTLQQYGYHYFGQATMDPFNQFSNQLQNRLGIEDRIPISNSDAQTRANYIAKSLGFEDIDDMIIRRKDAEYMASKGRSAPGKPAQLGLFKFLQNTLMQTGQRKILKRNSGGIVGTGPAFKSQLFSRLGAGISKSSSHGGYDINSLKLGMGKKLFSGTGLSPKAQNLMYNALVQNLQDSSPDGYVKTQSGKMFRGFVPGQTSGMIFGAAMDVSRLPGITKKDREILAAWSSDPFKNNYSKGLLGKITGKMFGYNEGGVVGGEVRIGKHNYGIPGLDVSGLNQPMLIEQMGLQAPKQSSMSQMEMPQRGPSFMGNLGTTMAYMGGSTAGAMLGQKVGGGFGSLAGMIIVPAILQSIMQKLGKVSAQGASTAGVLGRLGPLLTNPYVAAGAAIVGVTAALIKFKKHQEEVAKLNRLAFSGGVKPIRDFDSQLKQVTKNIENTRATAELLHAQMNTAGLSGLTLTIKEFSDLREKVKSTYPELVKLFNQTPSDKLLTVAQGLKAQFVAAGNSAAQANAKIAALLAESGKSGFIQVILGDKGLSNITNAKTAIESMLVAMSKFTDSKDRAAGLLQVFSSMGDYIENAKDKSVALKEQYDAIAKSGQGNVKLTQDQINEIAKVTPELANVLSTSDDIGTALSKWRITLGGVQKDLSGLDKGQLEKLAIAVEAVNARYKELMDVSSKAAQENSLTGKLAKDIDAFNKKQVNASRAAIQSLETQIDLKNKQIEQIKKEGDARKKALRDQQQAEDTKLQIQQEQLNYQTALAKGDMAGAAQAQINIQRLVGAQQLKVAEDAIDKAVQTKIDALQAQIDVLNKKSTAVSSAASNAKPQQSPLQSIYEGIQTVYRDKALGSITEEEALIRFNDLIKKLEQTKGITAKDKSKYLQDLGITGSVNNITREDGQRSTTKIDTTTAAGQALQAGLEKGSKDIAGKQLSVLQQILEVLKNQPGKTYTPTPSQTQNAGATTAAGGTYAVGTIQNYTNSTSSIKSAGIKALSDSATGHATVGNKTYKLFKYGDKAYGIETPSGMVYEWNTNTNTIGTTLIGNASSKKSNFALGGAVRKYGTAGFVSGPGTGTSDSIPAMLSNGEYVIRAASVQAVGTSFLDGINKMSAGGIATKYSIPRMSMGGRVNMSTAGQASTSNAVYNINVTVDKPDSTADEIARAIEQRMRRMQSKEGPSKVIA